MPKKSIREMTSRERKRHSLESRLFVSIALFSIILGLVCFGMGLLMYMYGLAQESMDSEGHQFGTGRMVEALNAEPGASPEKLLANVRASVSDFVKDAEQFDDITMLCIEYNGNI